MRHSLRFLLPLFLLLALAALVSFFPDRPTKPDGSDQPADSSAAKGTIAESASHALRPVAISIAL